MAVSIEIDYSAETGGAEIMLHLDFRRGLRGSGRHREKAQQG